MSAPWDATLSPSEHSLILYFLLLAGAALFASFIRTWATQGEVGVRYRSAVVARLGINAVATAAYAILLFAFDRGYDETAAGFVPNGHAIELIAVRYADWSVTVPLIVIELFAVCAIAGVQARRIRSIAVGAAFLMIFAGFLGGAIDFGGSIGTQRIIGGAVSAVFWVVLMWLIIRTVRRSIPQLTAESGALLTTATRLLLVGWVFYPIVYLIPVFFEGGAWTTAIFVGFSIADIVVKVGFAGLIHRIAKLRTAEDVRAGNDIHPEAIWITSVKQSDSGVPSEVYLAEGASAHARRARPATDEAVPTPNAAEETTLD